MGRIRILKTLDATLGWFLCRLLGHVDYWRRGGRPVTTFDLGPIRRILVIRPGGIGDMIVLLPAIRALERRFPDARIDVACEKRNAGVLRLAGFRHNLLLYDANPPGFLLRLLRGGYDVAVDTEQFHHFSAIFALLSGARTRIGFKINPTRNPLYTHLVTYALEGPEGEQFLGLLAPLGVDGAPPPLAGIWAGVQAPLPALCAAELGPEACASGLAVIHAGCSTPYKLWDEARYVEAARRLHAAHGLAIALAGDGRDARAAGRIAAALRAAGVPAVSFAGRIPLDGAAALVRHARLFLGADSGLAHLATALGVPSVVLFGPSDARKWGSREGRHAVVTARLPCAPCFIFGYHRPCRTFDCMRQIGVEAVAEACERVLAAGDGSAHTHPAGS